MSNESEDRAQGKQYVSIDPDKRPMMPTLTPESIQFLKDIQQAAEAAHEIIPVRSSHSSGEIG